MILKETDFCKFIAKTEIIILQCEDSYLYHGLATNIYPNWTKIATSPICMQILENLNLKSIQSSIFAVNIQKGLTSGEFSIKRQYLIEH